MAYITGITLKNFRVFKDATEFEFAPLTILTGANNSGKSTVLKALLLLADSMKKNGLEELDFTGEHHHLGGLESVLNEKEEDIVSIVKFMPEYENSLDSYTEKITQFIIHDLKQEYPAIDNYMHSRYGLTDLDYANYDNVINAIGNQYLLFSSFQYKDGKVLDYFLYNLQDNLVFNENKFSSDLGISLKRTPYQIEDLEKAIKTIEPKKVRLLKILNATEQSKNQGINKLIGEIFALVFSSIDIKNSSPYPWDIAHHEIDIDTVKLRGQSYDHRIIDWIEKIFKIILQSAFQLEYLPPIKANTQRLYTYQSQGTLFNDLLVQYTKNGASKDEKKTTFIYKWLGEEGFGIADKVEFVPIGTYGNAVKIWKNGKELELADLGFGITALLPLLMKIVLCKTKLLMIEEPENSLHPNFQTKLADLFIDAQETFGLRFIIETHSEYLIRRLQILTAEKKITPDNTSIYYFYNPDDVPKGKKQVERINIEEDGSLDNDFGEGFFDMATQMRFELLKLKKELNAVKAN
ncbi:MAG: DUF3696 domain-containing protein [Chitinophagales bacterium]